MARTPKKNAFYAQSGGVTAVIEEGSPEEGGGKEEGGKEEGGKEEGDWQTSSLMGYKVSRHH